MMIKSAFLFFVLVYWTEFKQEVDWHLLQDAFGKEVRSSWLIYFINIILHVHCVSKCQNHNIY